MQVQKWVFFTVNEWINLAAPSGDQKSKGAIVWCPQMEIFTEKKSSFLGIPFNFGSGTMPPWTSIRDWPIFKGTTIQSPQMEICYTSFLLFFVCFCLGSPLISAVRPWRSVRDWPVERCSQSWRNCNGVPVSHGWWCSSPKNTNKSNIMTACQLQWKQTFWRRKKSKLRPSLCTHVFSFNNELDQFWALCRRLKQQLQGVVRLILWRIGPKCQTQCWRRFNSPVQQEIFLPGSTFSADSLMVLVQLLPLCTISYTNVCMPIQNPKHWRPYTIAWTHENAANTMPVHDRATVSYLLYMKVNCSVVVVVVYCLLSCHCQALSAHLKMRHLTSVHNYHHLGRNVKRCPCLL